MRSHEIDYQVFGDDLQFVEVELDPGETVIAEAGMMMYMEDGIGFETKMGDGSKPKAGFLDKVVSVGMRAITGESLFLTHFSNVTPAGKKRVAFGAPYPGKIMAIDLDEANGELICQKDAFLCAALGTELSIAFNKKLGAGLFGGEGFILQRLRGDGMLFLHAGGSVIEKRLNNEKILVDTGCIVAFESAISYDIQRAGNLKSMIFGGEGLFLATLQGTGRIWLQSLPFSRLADRILKFAPSQGGKSAGEGSIVNGAVRFLQQ
ncbi:MAG TPA: TIGR00266 family protein [Chloroflexi bacterium]|nr:TIGR00266 family protein [Chloroflexota bacterium]